MLDHLLNFSPDSWSRRKVISLIGRRMLRTKAVYICLGPVQTRMDEHCAALRSGCTGLSMALMSPNHATWTCNTATSGTNMDDPELVQS